MISIEDQKVLHRLGEYKEYFLKLRGAFKVDDRIGLGSLPDAHDAYSLGRLINVRTSNKGKLIYSYIDYQGPKSVMLDEDETEKIIVPSHTGKERPFILSIYQKKGFWEPDVFEAKVLEAPDEVFDGVVAHELSHYIRDFGNIPGNIQAVIRRHREKYMDVYRQVKNTEVISTKDSGFEFLNTVNIMAVYESEIDILASLYGYKKGVLAKLDYMIECLESYSGPETNGRYLTPKQAVEQMRFRKNEVNSFA